MVPRSSDWARDQIAEPALQNLVGGSRIAYLIHKLVEHEQRVIRCRRNGRSRRSSPARRGSGSRLNPCRARCHGVAFGRAQGRSTGQTGRQERRSSWAPRAIASRSAPSDSAKPRSSAPLCRRQSSASPDRGGGARRRSHPRIRQGDQIPTAGTTRPMRADHSCHCVRRPEHHPPSRSNRARRRVRDKPATQHRRSPGSRETGHQAAVEIQPNSI